MSPPAPDASPDLAGIEKRLDTLIRLLTPVSTVVHLDPSTHPVDAAEIAIENALSQLKKSVGGNESDGEVAE